MTVRLWDVSSGNEITKLIGHNADVWSVAFSPDGRRLASIAGLREGDELRSETIVWDLKSESPVMVFHEDRAQGVGSAPVNSSVTFSPDGQTIATAGPSIGARLWDLRPGRSPRKTDPRVRPGMNVATGSTEANDASSSLARSSVMSTPTLLDRIRQPEHRSRIVPLYKVLLTNVASDDLEGAARAFVAVDQLLADTFTDLEALEQRVVIDRLYLAKQLIESDRQAEADALVADLLDDDEVGSSHRQALSLIYYEAAEKRKNEFEACVELCSRSIAINPKNRDAHILSGQANSELGRTSRSIADFTNAIEQDPLNPIRVQIRGLSIIQRNVPAYRAEEYVKLGKYRSAHLDFDGATVGRGRSSSESRFRYSEVVAALGAENLAASREALEDFFRAWNDRKARNFNGVEDARRLAWACVLVPRGIDDYGQPIELAEKIVDAAPDRLAHLNCLGGVLYRAGRFEDAVPWLHRAAHATDENAIHSVYACLLLAMVHHELGDPVQAIEWMKKGNDLLEEVFSASGEHEIAWDQELALLLLLGEAHESVAVDPGPPIHRAFTARALHLRGLLWLNQRRFVRAEKMLADAFNLLDERLEEPSGDRAHTRQWIAASAALGECWNRLGKLEDAKRLLTRAMDRLAVASRDLPGEDLDFESVDRIHRTLFDLATQTGSPDAAETLLDAQLTRWRLLEVELNDPTNSHLVQCDLHDRMGQWLSDQGRTDEALQHVERAKTQFLAATKSRPEVSRHILEQTRPEQRVSLTSSPLEHYALEEKVGTAREAAREDDPELAGRSWQCGTWDTWSLYALAYYRGRGANGVNEDVKLAVQLADGDPNLLSAIAPILLPAGETDEYQRICRDVLARRNSNAPSFRRAKVDGVPYEEVDRKWLAPLCAWHPEATADPQRLVGLLEQDNNDSPFWVSCALGLVHSRAGNHDEAIDVLERGLSALAPENLTGRPPDDLVARLTMYRFALAIARHRRGDIEIAQTWLGRAMDDLPALRAPEHAYYVRAGLHALLGEATQLITDGASK